ncbi:MAG TPA: DUF4405 domain-containing protein [Burkholderiaceae bacterium]|nr:DUF4405 domain-containing protein [Burkholderiaceae bacterium]HMN84235.1 DUF4405 domain-containing protein [Burkholderiaceae bacterium]
MASLNRVAPWQRRLLHASAWLLAASGVAWLGIHYLWGAGAGELPHPLEPWLIRLHGAAAFAALFVAGVLSAGHIPNGWRLTAPKMRRADLAGQRRTGLAMTTLGAAAVFSGYLLYYFAPEPVRPSLGWVHAIIGLTMALLVPLHGSTSARGG